MKPLESPPVLTLLLVLFTVVFSVFLFFNEDVLAKVLVCGSTGIFIVLIAAQLIRVTRRRK